MIGVKPFIFLSLVWIRSPTTTPTYASSHHHHKSNHLQTSFHSTSTFNLIYHHLNTDLHQHPRTSSTSLSTTIIHRYLEPTNTAIVHQQPHPSPASTRPTINPSLAYFVHFHIHHAHHWALSPTLSIALSLDSLLLSAATPIVIDSVVDPSPPTQAASPSRDTAEQRLFSTFVLPIQKVSRNYRLVQRWENFQACSFN